MTDPTDNLPPSLQDALRRAHTPSAPFSPERDAAILAAYRPARRRWLPLSAAAAIALLISGGLLYHLAAPLTPAPYAKTGDIRDAYFLARQLAAHQPPPPDFDANHDGHIDNADVRQLAMLAVRVTP